MQVPSSVAPAPPTASERPLASAAPSAAPTIQEIVHRPDGALRRGKWEAPTIFFVLVAVAVVAAAAFVAFRLYRKNRS